MSIHKSQAIQVLGGAISAAARALCSSHQSDGKWPDILSSKVSHRVLAVWAHKHVEILPGRLKLQLLYPLPHKKAGGAEVWALSAAQPERLFASVASAQKQTPPQQQSRI